MDKEDMFQAGIVGLLKACEKYNPTLGDWVPYAQVCIRREIYAEMRRCRWGSWYAWREGFRVHLSDDIETLMDLRESHAPATWQVAHTEREHTRWQERYCTKRTHRAEVLSRRLQGADNATIARELNTIPDTIASHLNHIKAHLKKQLNS